MEKDGIKIAITPCAGIGQIFGPITREAGYRLVEDLYPDHIFLNKKNSLCMAKREANLDQSLN